MRKQTKYSVTRIKRKNQNSRTRGKSRTKKPKYALLRTLGMVNDTVPPRTKSLWPNQAQPKLTI